jgi:integrase
MMTVREFGEQLFTSNELARRYRKRVREVDHTENIRRLNNHVYPVVYNGRSIADTPLDEFELDQADFVLDQPTVPDGSIRHVAQVMHRLFALAVYPARLLKQSPFPRGWLPAANDPKERSYLFPEEEAAVLGLPHEQLPLVWRVFFGFCAREGLRRENAVTIEWSDIHFDVGTGGSTVSLDTTKNGRGGFWKLDAGTAEALRRWKPMCPSERLVFPAEAHPRYWRKRAGKPLQVDKAAERLRDGLIVASTLEEKAGRKRIRLRAQLLERSENRIRLRAHDLRATFVTLALALGKTEAWVTQRTGHLSSTSIRGYMRDAETAEELDLGWLEPMHEVIPELAAVGHDEDVGNDVPTFPGAEKSE